MEPITFKVKKCQTPSDFSASFSLQLIGSLPVHSLTTMSMLPWIVAEIRMLSTKSSKEEPGISQVRLYVSPASLRCEPDTGKIQQWDPLICSSLFEYKPQHVHKLIHNSHDPSYFACLIKDEAANQQSICYVFKADDQTKDYGEYNARSFPVHFLLHFLLQQRIQDPPVSQMLTEEINVKKEGKNPTEQMKNQIHIFAHTRSSV